MRLNVRSRMVKYENFFYQYCMLLPIPPFPSLCTLFSLPVMLLGQLLPTSRSVCSALFCFYCPPAVSVSLSLPCSVVPPLCLPALLHWLPALLCFTDSSPALLYWPPASLCLSGYQPCSALLTTSPALLYWPPVLLCFTGSQFCSTFLATSPALPSIS